MDTGLDEVVWYSRDGSSDDGVTVAKLPDGSLPRHVCFSPGSRSAYVVTEATNVIVAYEVSSDVPLQFRELQSLTTLPSEYQWKSSCGAVKCSPDGTLVAVSNRGADTIALFSRDDATGLLEQAGVLELPGQCPRDFAFSEGGQVLAVALQESDGVVAYAVEGLGRVSQIGSMVSVPRPACVKFLPGL